MESLLHLDPKFLNSFQIVKWGYTEELTPTSYDQYQKWVEQELHGPLNYLADERMKKRKSLTHLYSDCKSALVFLFDYRAAKKWQEEVKPKHKIASYAIGFEDQDYHYWIYEKLEMIGKELHAKLPELEFKISLDIHPVLERDLAYRAGLGWFGKNSMLINREVGSYQLIGSLLLNQKIELTTNSIDTDHCGNCRKCIDACPTSAIRNDRTLDSNLCISTYTIELFKDAEPPKGYPTETNEVFGCDICQEVCPWNDKPLKEVTAINSSELADGFNKDLANLISEHDALSNKGYKLKYQRTSFERLGKKGLIKNLKKYF